MKIFVIPAVFPNDKYPFAGIFVYQQCVALAKEGHEIIVLDASAMDYQDWLHLPYYQEIKEYHKNLFWIHRKHHRGFMLSRFPKLALYSYQRALRHLFSSAIVQHGKPDLLYGHFSFCAGFLTSKLAKENGIPCIIQEHASLLFSTKNNTILSMLNHSINESNGFFCVSPSLRQSILEKNLNYTKEIGVLHNIINASFQYSPPPNNENFVFFSAGNLVATKAFDMLINAFQIAFSKEDKVELRIAGTGREEKKLKSFAIQRIHQIKFLGALSKEEMIDQYKKANCFTTASHTETFGLVYREALAVGRPIVCTKNTGIQYLWNPAYGKLCEQTLEDLAQELKAMYYDYKNYNGKKISDSVLKDFGEIAFLNHFQQITKDITK